MGVPAFYREAIMILRSLSQMVVRGLSQVVRSLSQMVDWSMGLHQFEGQVILGIFADDDDEPPERIPMLLIAVLMTLVALLFPTTMIVTGWGCLCFGRPDLGIATIVLGGFLLAGQIRFIYGRHPIR